MFEVYCHRFTCFIKVLQLDLSGPVTRYWSPEYVYRHQRCIWIQIKYNFIFYGSMGKHVLTNDKSVSAAVKQIKLTDKRAPDESTTASQQECPECESSLGSFCVCMGFR